MSEPHRTRGRRARTDDQLVQRILFDATWRFAWRALARYRLDDADRDDIAQEAVITAWRYLGRYRADRGNPEQWLSRIVRNAAIDFLSARREGRETVDVLAGVPSEDLPLEERMSMREVADLVFAVLPEDERRAVIALAIEGLTLREAAAVEGVSASTMHERYERGVAALRAAVERGDDRKLFAIPFPFAQGESAAIDDADPPPELLDHAWQRFVAEGGLDGLPDSEPPASGAEHREPTCADDAPPSSRPRGSVAKLLRLLGPVGGALIGAAVAGIAMRCGDHVLRSDPDPAREEALAAAAPSPAVVHYAPAAVEPGRPSGGPNAVEAPVTMGGDSPYPPARPVTMGAVAERSRPKIRERRDEESALVERGRVALVQGDAVRALRLLAQHAQQYPRGAHAALREALVGDACAHTPVPLTPPTPLAAPNPGAPRAPADPRCALPGPP